MKILNDLVIVGSKAEFRDGSSHVFEFFSGNWFNFVPSDRLNLFDLIEDVFNGLICLLKTRITQTRFRFFFFFLLLFDGLKLILVGLICLDDHILVFDWGERVVCIIDLDNG